MNGSRISGVSLRSVIMFHDDEVVVVGRCQIWRQSRQSLRSGVTAFCEAIDLLHRSIIFARVAPRPTNGKTSFILKLFADAHVQLRRSQWPLPELLPVH